MKMSVLPVGAFAAVVCIACMCFLQSCTVPITRVKPGRTDATVTVPDSKVFAEAVGFADNWPLTEIGDSLFVYTMRLSSDSIALVKCDGQLRTIWTTTYTVSNSESKPYIWYCDSILTLISTENYGELNREVPFALARSFDAVTGARLAGDTTRKLPEMYWPYGELNCYESANKKVLLLRSGGYDDAKKGTTLYTAQLFVLRKGEPGVVQKTVHIYLPEEHEKKFSPSFAVNNRGDVFYSFYRDGYAESREQDGAEIDSSIHQSVVRLPLSGVPDTITCSYPALYEGWYLKTATDRMCLVSDNVMFHTWQYIYDSHGGNTAFFAVDKLDFAKKKIIFTDTLLRSHEDCQYLANSYMLNNYQIRGFYGLPRNEALLVVEREYKRLSNNSYYEAGPIIVVKLDSIGRVQWQSALTDERVVFVGEQKSVGMRDSTSLGVLYRNKNVDDGISYAEWNLADGTVHSRELPVVIPHYYQWLSRPTLVYNKRTVTTYVYEDGVVRLITMKLRTGAILPLGEDAVKRLPK